MQLRWEPFYCICHSPDKFPLICCVLSRINIRRLREAVVFEPINNVVLWEPFNVTEVSREYRLKGEFVRYGGRKLYSWNWWQHLNRSVLRAVGVTRVSVVYKKAAVRPRRK